MRVMKVTLGRQLKVGLPQYSSSLFSAFVEWEIAEGETPDFKEMWKTVDGQVTAQANSSLAGPKIAPTFSKKTDSKDLPF